MLRPSRIPREKRLRSRVSDFEVERRGFITRVLGRFLKMWVLSYPDERRRLLGKSLIGRSSQTEIKNRNLVVMLHDSLCSFEDRMGPVPLVLEGICPQAKDDDACVKSELKGMGLRRQFALQDRRLSQSEIVLVNRSRTIIFASFS
mmetsp:Transcript_13301/g.20789  ORF Transcript_13301/g.20789 Transcript_13301/m.20789 type:complete len:146 (+) Transcript_13301:724-1161(+)